MTLTKEETAFLIEALNQVQIKGREAALVVSLQRRLLEAVNRKQASDNARVLSLNQKLAVLDANLKKELEE